MFKGIFAFFITEESVISSQYVKNDYEASIKTFKENVGIWMVMSF